MRAFVHLRDPAGVLHELAPGDIVGRLRSAALPLDDGRVSEAHAMVSLREGELRLIALRGSFAVGGRPRAEVALAPGVEVQLARGLSLRVEAVELPEDVLGVEGPGLPAQALPGVASLLDGPRLLRGWREDAAAWIWSTGGEWSLRAAGGAERALRAGDRVALPGGEVRFVAMPLRAAGHSETRRHGGVDAPLVVVASCASVALHRDGDVVLGFGGVHARLVGELVAMGGRAPWRVLAGELWPDLDDDPQLRSRLDVTLSRLRRRLRDGRVRTDLVCADGAGTIELLLDPHDRLEDRT